MLRRIRAKTCSSFHLGQRRLIPTQVPASCLKKVASTGKQRWGLSTPQRLLLFIGKPGDPMVCEKMSDPFCCCPPKYDLFKHDHSGRFDWRIERQVYATSPHYSHAENVESAFVSSERHRNSRLQQTHGHENDARQQNLTTALFSRDDLHTYRERRHTTRNLSHTSRIRLVSIRMIASRFLSTAGPTRTYDMTPHIFPKISTKCTCYLINRDT
jgi:hypothetical protein